MAFFSFWAKRIYFNFILSNTHIFLDSKSNTILTMYIFVGKSCIKYVIKKTT